MIEINKVCKYFENSSTRKDVLYNVSIQIKENEIFGLIGQNGSGKSTLLKIISGLLMPSSGNCNLGNYSSSISLITPNNRSFYWRLTLKENLEFFSKLNSLTKENYESEISSLSNYFDISKKLDTKFMHLSEGEMQKASIIRGLIFKPKLVLFDEPTSYLDQRSSKLLVDYVKNYICEGRIAIWCSHDIDNVEDLSTKIGVVSGNNVHLFKSKQNERICTYNLETNDKKIFAKLDSEDIEYDYYMNNEKFFINFLLPDEKINDFNSFLNINLSSYSMSKNKGELRFFYNKLLKK